MRRRRGIKYEDYQRLIAGVAWSWAKRSGWDFGDLMSEGNLVFCEIQKTFDPSQSRFSTYLTNRLNYHFGGLNSERKTRERMDGLFRPIDREKDPDDVPSRDCSPDRAAALGEMIGHLSHDARLMVECILETPLDLIEMLRRDRTGMKVSMHVLQRYFTSRRGWGIGRCWKVFKEVRLALATL